MILSILIAHTLQTPTPGAYLLAGGGSTSKAMVAEFAQLCGGKDSKIFVLAQTREDPTKGSSSVDLLKEEGFKDVESISDKEFDESKKAVLASKFKKAKGFWVPGGDQNLLIERFGQKWLHDQIDAQIKQGASWFGTSAGAMAVSDPMIGGNLPDGNPKIVPGAGLVDILIDTHFRTRKRENRMRFAFHRGKYQMAIGLDEGEWVVIRNNQIEKKFGDPMIVLKESGNY
jgi:cyanophycinase